MKIPLYLCVFIGGAVVMILELAGSRIVAPYVGTSIIVWTSLIGIFLGSLSLGYIGGGKVADRYPSLTALSTIALLSAFFISLIPWALSLVQGELANYPLYLAALICATALFAPATILLGMIAPYAAKLALQDLKKAGSTVGRLYAFSTLGSIVGTFLGGFVLTPLIGTTKITLALALTMVVVHLVLFLASWSRPKWYNLLLLVITIFTCSNLVWPVLVVEGKVVADIDTNFSRIWVVDDQVPGDERVIRSLNNSIYGAQSAIFKDDPTTPVYGYIKNFTEISRFYTREYPLDRALVIGGAAYTYPRVLLELAPKATVDVVEIDPGITALAKKYFSLAEEPGFNIFHEDGRLFLNRDHLPYDLILVDAFQADISIPFHIVTREAVERMAKSLAPEGVIVVNIIASVEGPGNQVARALLATYQEIFPEVFIAQVNQDKELDKPQNLALVATRSAKISQDLQKGPNLKVVDLGVSDANLVLTDDFAPVEFYTSSALP